LLFGWIHSMPEHTFSAITTDSNTKLNYWVTLYGNDYKVEYKLLF
jgi:hypothetical protein